MWYFSWILGVGVALAAGVISALWFEAHDDRHASHRKPGKPAALRKPVADAA
ncbi:Cytochrome bd ubiquinol oxidase subunit X [Pararobbsia alpina]|jgi:cytochrome bd-I ubiquinol oxidase subunit X|uniref:cytochrome bd-I oxidase subunit CydX n=1 Tax=Pararobbsia alpina TaxID=621374 RepID=UPI0039A47E6F